MKTKTLKSFVFGIAVFGAALVTTSAATYITGDIAFTGGATLNGPLATATSFTSFFGTGGSPTVLAATGSYSAIPNGTPVAFNVFTFNPQPFAATQLWSVNVGGTTYSFDLSTVAISFQSSSFLNLQGTGVAYINDGNHLPTTGTWNITATGFSTMPVVSFAYVASVPEPSTAALILGAGLITVAFRRVRSRV
ncbi:MAG TPA: PEP-CTERM sorting domain-containing protein [Candidatus Paceibacterota bacterium]|nr:PEP-CTERM sorting domain-containing protein [Candidatus Paceibacterota bacterium]